VGTSAGSLVGALLRRGVPASDLSGVTSRRRAPRDPRCGRRVAGPAGVPGHAPRVVPDRTASAEPRRGGGVGPPAMAPRPGRRARQRASRRDARPARACRRDRAGARHRLASGRPLDLRRPSPRPPSRGDRAVRVGVPDGRRVCFVRRAEYFRPVRIVDRDHIDGVSGRPPTPTFCSTPLTSSGRPSPGPSWPGSTTGPGRRLPAPPAGPVVPPAAADHLLAPTPEHGSWPRADAVRSGTASLGPEETGPRDAFADPGTAELTGHRQDTPSPLPVSPCPWTEQ
jgi:hypothetical protein